MIDLILFSISTVVVVATIVDFKYTRANYKRLEEFEEKLSLLDSYVKLSKLNSFSINELKEKVERLENNVSKLNSNSVPAPQVGGGFVESDIKVPKFINKKQVRTTDPKQFNLRQRNTIKATYTRLKELGHSDVDIAQELNIKFGYSKTVSAYSRIWSKPKE